MSRPNAVKKYGPTEPISTASPTPRDYHLTSQLEECLHVNNRYETQQGLQLREQVLQDLVLISQKWVTSVALSLGLPEHDAQNSGVRVCTFGSYRLGVAGPGSDIDTLIITPRYISRNEHMFGLINTSIENPVDKSNENNENSNNENIVLMKILENDINASEIIGVHEAYVPVIKLKYRNVEIDLLCAPLQMSHIPKDIDILDDKILRNVDEQTQRSINGVRVTDAMLSLVPNIPNFRIVLRAIKLWANRRQIYSNAMGYCGGVAWAILTARVCQLYPNGSPSLLISRFFRLYEKWKWSNIQLLQNHQPAAPVLLCNIPHNNTLGFRVWNPINNYKHVMPIITPSYPSMNSTHNVSISTLGVMKIEITRGRIICDDIEKKGSAIGIEDWQELFKESEFFMDFKRFLQIDIFADNGMDFKRWLGFCVSRLRQLVSRLEDWGYAKVIRPYAKGFSNNPNLKLGCGHSYFIGLTFNPPPIENNDGDDGGRRPTVDISGPVKIWKKMVREWQDRSHGMDTNVSIITRNDLPCFVGDIDKIVSVKNKGKKKKKKKKRKHSNNLQQQEQKSNEQNDDNNNDEQGENNGNGVTSQAGAKRRREDNENIDGVNVENNENNNKQVENDRKKAKAINNEEENGHENGHGETVATEEPTVIEEPSVADRLRAKAAAKAANNTNVPEVVNDELVADDVVSNGNVTTERNAINVIFRYQQ